MNEVKRVLDNFGKEVVSGAKRKLAQKKKNASKQLSNSIDYDTKVSKNSFEFSISMEDYGVFVDQGVHGVGGKKADGTQWKKKRVVGSKFKYRKKRPPASAFSSWTVRKGIAPRTKGGQFAKRKSLQFAIAESVYRTGLETTHFLQDPFEKAFKDLPQDVVEAYGLQVEEFLKFSLK